MSSKSINERNFTVYKISKCFRNFEPLKSDKMISWAPRQKKRKKTKTVVGIETRLAFLKTAKHSKTWQKNHTI